MTLPKWTHVDLERPSDEARTARELVRPEISFWRTQAGAEVDLLIGAGRRLVPIEIKATHSVGAHDVRGLRECMKDLGVKRGFVVMAGGERRLLGKDIELVPWSLVVSGEMDFGLGWRWQWLP